MSEAVSGAVEGADQSSFEAALAAALGSVDSAEQEAPPDGPAQVSAAPAPVAAVPPAPATPEAPSPAQLERAAALDAREAKLRAAEDAARAREEQSTASSAQWDKFVADPVGHIRAMRPELSASEAALVAERFYFHAMGDKAPLEHRQREAVTQVKAEVSSEVEKLRAEVQELRSSRERMEQEKEVSSYKSELCVGAESATDAPIVANLAKRNPTRAAEMLYEVARREAIESKQRGDAEPVVLTPAQAAAKLEAILKAERDDLYGPIAPVAQPNVQQNVPSPTITNRDASIQPGRVTPDPLDDKTLRKAALEAAGLGHLEVWD